MLYKLGCIMYRSSIIIIHFNKIKFSHMEVYNSHQFPIHNSTIGIGNSKKYKSNFRLNYKTFDEEIKKMARIKKMLRKESLLKEMFYGMMQPTPEWAIYGLFLTNFIFVFIMVLSCVFDIVPCDSMGNFIKASGVVVNTYLSLYFSSRTED